MSTKLPASWRRSWNVLLLSVAALASSCHECELRDDSELLAVDRVDVPRERIAHLISAPAPVEGPTAAAATAEPVGDVVRATYSLSREGHLLVERVVDNKVGFLGVVFSQLDEDKARELDLEPFSGVLVVRVEPHSPAANNGLRADDVVLALNGEPARSPSHLRYLIRRTLPGEGIELDLASRENSSTKLAVTLTSTSNATNEKVWETDLAVADDRDRTGMKVVELTEAARQVIVGRAQERRGVVIVSIYPGSPAYFSDLRVRDLLVRLGDRDIVGQTDFKAAVAAAPRGKEIPAVALRGDHMVETKVRVRDNVTAESSVDLFLFDFRSSAYRPHIHLLKGLLFNRQSCRSVRHQDGEFRHVTKGSWGVALNLIYYESRPTKKKLHLAWILPLTLYRSD